MFIWFTKYIATKVMSHRVTMTITVMRKITDHHVLECRKLATLSRSLFFQ